MAVAINSVTAGGMYELRREEMDFHQKRLVFLANPSEDSRPPASFGSCGKKHPDFDLFQSFPGAGEALVPRLIAAFGTRRDRWANAPELQCYSGIAPVLETSGRQRWVHVRWACPKFVRQTFHEWALHSITKCKWARAHYEVQMQRGKSRHAAIRSLAFNGSGSHSDAGRRAEYDPDLYQGRSSNKPTDLGVHWKACGSFPKIVAPGS